MTEQLWRRSTDSSALTAPRTFVRVFVSMRDWEATTAWYEALQGTERDMVMPYPEKNLLLSAVGGFLIIAGTEEALAPFRGTVGTQLVADIEPYARWFREQGLEFVEEPFLAPVGKGCTVRHPDGTVVEYVHHRPAEGEPSHGSNDDR